MFMNLKEQLCFFYSQYKILVIDVLYNDWSVFWGCISTIFAYQMISYYRQTLDTENKFFQKKMLTSVSVSISGVTDFGGDCFELIVCSWVWEVVGVKIEFKFSDVPDASFVKHSDLDSVNREDKLLIFVRILPPVKYCKRIIFQLWLNLEYLSKL